MPLTTDIESAIARAAERYYQLVLVVGPLGAGKTALLASYGDSVRMILHNVNLKISEEMLGLGERQRRTHVATVLSQLVEAREPAILLDNTEILFDRTLALNPLRLLQELSRNTVVVATWSGHYRDAKLTYADSSHPEFRSIDSVDAVIVNMETL